jgi:processive 1,2-diacylglycerol beta-glucosyltransferase
VKVLITSVPAGCGHVRAAEAVREALLRTAPYVEAMHVEVTDFVTPSFKKIYVDGYRVTVNRAPALWGHIYRYWDHRPPEAGLTPLLYKAQRFCSTGFYEYIDRFQPDLILTTHFLVPQLLAANPNQACRPAIESIITDYDVHRFWVSDNVSRYYVAHEDMKETLAGYGVPPSRVTVSGIPIHPSFSEPVSVAPLLSGLGLNREKPIILVLAGGFGLSLLKNAVEKLFTLAGGAQIVTISGKNEALRAQLGTLAPPPGVKLVHLEYVHNMHELLTISDLVITKPGGLTLSECLAKKKIMLFFAPIPGQEEKNAEFLTLRKAAAWAKSIDDLPTLAERLLTQRPVQGAILWNVERFSRPHAAFAIAESISRAACLAA